MVVHQGVSAVGSALELILKGQPPPLRIASSLTSACRVRLRKTGSPSIHSANWRNCRLTAAPVPIPNTCPASLCDNPPWRINMVSPTPRSAESRRLRWNAAGSTSNTSDNTARTSSAVKGRLV